MVAHDGVTRLRNWTFIDAYHETRQHRPIFAVGTARNVTAFPADADAPKWDLWAPSYDWNLTSIASMNTIQTAAEGARKPLKLRIIGGRRTGLTAVYEDEQNVGVAVIPDFTAKGWWDDYATKLAIINTNLGDCDNWVSLVLPSMFTWSEMFLVDATLWADVNDTATGEGPKLEIFDADWVENACFRQVDMALAAIDSRIEIQVDVNPLRITTGAAGSANHRAVDLDGLAALSPRVRFGQDSVRSDESSFGGQQDDYDQMHADLSRLTTAGTIDGWSGELALAGNTGAWGGSSATGTTYLTAINRALARGCNEIELFDSSATPWTNADIKAAFGRS